MKVAKKAPLRGWVFVVALALPGLFAFAHDSNPRANVRGQAAAAGGQKTPAEETLRLNTLGVAHLNQGKSADAQKYFERALAADKEFTAARMNLGISLLAQQKIEQARAALEEASAKLPNDAYAWYNLGLAYKDAGDTAKAIAAFQHVAQIAPEEPDAFYFEGYL